MRAPQHTREAFGGAAVPAGVGGGDLDSEAEIAEMVRRFYQDVAQDDLLGPVFEDVAEVDWGEHLPKLTAFWCRALLGLEGYSGNPFRAHARIHARSEFTGAHFQRWLDLFTDTVMSGWEGPIADRALELAHNVARVHSTQLTGRIPVGRATSVPSTGGSGS
ncbi:MAG: group III truncated hemoglobin [Microthrixaceae bacterium]|nr:group III truncated hemoglobin [Microthrixaceae bacterium]MCO5317944.1 group III truncated hemoglobin [Microthrixaceae bacterium]